MDEAASQKSITKFKRVKMLQILSLIVGVVLLLLSIILLRGEATHLCSERTVEAPTCEQEKNPEDESGRSTQSTFLLSQP
jgi:hypothetical protein